MRNLLKTSALALLLATTGAAFADETVPSVNSEAGMNKGQQVRENSGIFTASPSTNETGTRVQSTHRASVDADPSGFRAVYARGQTENRDGANAAQRRQQEERWFERATETTGG